jgi:hypothetical protein
MGMLSRVLKMQREGERGKKEWEDLLMKVIEVEGNSHRTSFSPASVELLSWWANGRYFAAEIIGNLLDLEPIKWRKPKKLDYGLNPQRAAKLGQWFQPYNWTTQLQQT